MTDALLQHEPDGGNLEIIEGRVTLSDGLATAVYLSLFGGNERDAGTDATVALEWWGNKTETDSVRRLRSRTQHLIDSLPLVPANLRRIEDAAVADLAWMQSGGFATFVGAVATIPGHRTVRLGVRVEVDGETHEFAFSSSAAVAQVTE